MSGEIGQLALCFALALAFVQAGAGLTGSRSGQERAAKIAGGAAFGFLVFTALAFATLIFAFVTSDFSVAVVAQNSHTTKPLLYKITGVWGNHEGSMVLWVLVLSVYSATVAAAQRGGARITSAALGVQGLLAIAFLLFILLTSDPFLRVEPEPFEGAGLNPLLQDPGLAFHPPMLYAGYVGLSATFAYGAAALITGEASTAWSRAARPFMLIAWIALTLGIALGSWWAYYVLGWGGFWFWDPVENASLMPWLVATALLHSSLATERTGAFQTWTLLLSIASFSFSLIGTFLVRSGIVTSVHAFANDPERGVFILLILSLAIGGALALFAWRAPKLGESTSFETVSRETFLLVNNVLLVGGLGIVFIGTIYPIVISLFGERLSVGAPYFNLLFVPLFLALLLFVPFGPRLSWQKASLAEAARMLAPAAGAAVVAALVVLSLIALRPVEGALAFAIATWLIASSATDLIRRRGSVRAGAFAAALAHAGLGVSLAGIAATTLWRSEALEVLAPGQTTRVGPYTLRLDRVEGVRGPNYLANRASIDVMENGTLLATLHPERRAYPAEGQEIVNTAIRTTGLRDLYVALGDERERGAWTVRAYVNPLAPLIWLGAGVMGLGGLISLTARLGRRARSKLSASRVPVAI